MEGYFRKKEYQIDKNKRYRYANAGSWIKGRCLQGADYASEKKLKERLYGVGINEYIRKTNYESSIEKAKKFYNFSQAMQAYCLIDTYCRYNGNKTFREIKEICAYMRIPLADNFDIHHEVKVTNSKGKTAYISFDPDASGGSTTGYYEKNGKRKRITNFVN